MNDRQRLEAIVGVVCRHLPPDGIPASEAMSQIISLVDPLPAPVQEMTVAKSFMVHLYNFGYKAGHHDTVEGRYIDICRQDMETYHLEDVSEWLQDMVYTTAAQPAQPAPANLWLYWKVDDKSVITGPFKTHSKVEAYGLGCIDQTTLTVPAAQRTWVGLTDEDKLTVRRMPWETLGDLMDNTEAKLMEKNNGGSKPRESP